MDIINDIAVSVAVITYNHGKFISQALESILMQNINFEYEIVIGDDCSPDDTQLIIQEYIRKYPDRINPILRKENIGIRKNADDIKKRCKGKYIIILEGDDYWTDPNKLQMQFNFLESHPEYIAVAHWCEVVDENGNISDEYAHKHYTFNFNKNIYSLKDYQKGRIPGHVNTILFRNIYLKSVYEYEKIFSANSIMGDRTLYLILVLLGDIFVFHKEMSHYRYVKKKGNTNYCSKIIGKNQSLSFFNYYSDLERYVYEIMGRKISLRGLKYQRFYSSISSVIKNPTEENKDIMKKIYSKLDQWEMIRFLPILLIKQIVNSIIWRMKD